jgi:hypothetical protein
MDIRAFGRAYARSPLGIGSLLVALAAGLVVFARGAPLGLALLLAFGLFLIFSVLALAFGLGQKAAEGELDRERRSQAENRLEEAAAARARLASMRLSEDEVAKARDFLVLEAGSYVEACRREGSYDPETVEAVLDSLALVDAWLKEEDEASIERRFDQGAAIGGDREGASAGRSQGKAASAATLARALREKAAFVAGRRSAITGEVSATDRLEIEEELK